jgi:hypothetical protein
VTIRRFYNKANLSDKIIILLYILAFTGATSNHIQDIIKGGLFPYIKWNVPFFLNFYWTSLTLLDPLSIGILLINIRTGLWFYLAVMVSDVAVNIYSNAVYWKVPLILQTALLLQIVFLLFLILTFKRIYAAADDKK